MTIAKPHRRLRRGAYLLPSLFTFGNILLGFYAVVCGVRGQFYEAAWMILIAGVADGLDGRIARLTGTESEFGREFDSLADVLTFGAAPAYLAYLWGGDRFERLSWVIPLFFLLCTAVRLARYNVQTKTVDSRSFVGLPSPAAAGSIACILFLREQLELRPSDGFDLIILIGLYAALVLFGALMISTFRYPSFKRLDLRERRSYRSAMLIAVVLLLLAVEPELFFQSLAVIYVLWGPGSWLLGRRRRRRSAPSTASEPATADAGPTAPTS
ncbi:MAG: CDP-diacylglycerol--serine O-phosphatidyltransferase [Acidobacteriota bacterium]